MEADTPSTWQEPAADRRRRRLAWAAGAVALVVAVLAAVVILVPRDDPDDDRVVVVGAASKPAYDTGYQPDSTKGLPDAGLVDTESRAANQILPDPFLGYVGRDSSGKVVNTSAGERKTYQPKGLQDGDPEVWVFGGSAAFGYGTQRDEHTIASDIARRAEADGVRIRVRNFAYPGYQNYQETLKLSQLLATGGRPDVVIFYDGYNNRMFDAGRLLLGDFGATSFSHINYATVVDLLAKSADIEIPPSRGVNIGRPVDPEQLAPQLVAMYRSGIDLAQHLAKGYGFTVIHTYQPDIFAKRLEGDEDKVLQAFGYDDQMVRAERKLSTEVRKTMPPEVVDLSDVFDDTREPVMANLVHTNEQGAVIIADAIWPLVEPHVTN